jgi:hypothetical protein
VTRKLLERVTPGGGKTNFFAKQREVDNKKVTNTWRVIEERRNEKKAKHTRLSEGFLNE